MAVEAVKERREEMLVRALPASPQVLWQGSSAGPARSPHHGLARVLTVARQDSKTSRFAGKTCSVAAIMGVAKAANLRRREKENHRGKQDQHTRKRPARSTCSCRASTAPSEGVHVRGGQLRQAHGHRPRAAAGRPAQRLAAGRARGGQGRRGEPVRLLADAERQEHGARAGERHRPPRSPRTSPASSARRGSSARACSTRRPRRQRLRGRLRHSATQRPSWRRSGSDRLESQPSSARRGGESRPLLARSPGARPGHFPDGHESRPKADAYSQPQPSWSASSRKTSRPTTLTSPVYSGPLPRPPMQS